MATDPQEELLCSLKELHLDPVYQDLSIICGSDQYKVHRAIVCPRSRFFAAACKSGLKEGNTGIIELGDDDPQAVKLMIHYLYHLDYPQQQDPFHPFLPDPEAASFTFRPTDSPTSKSRKKSSKHSKKEMTCEQEDLIITSNLIIHARVYALAEKYEIRGLKSTALAKFKKDADRWWSSPDFLYAAQEVYRSTIVQDREMRNLVIETIAQHPEILDSSQAQNLIQELDLCYDLMMRFRPKLKGAFGY